jgi:hypothetical protein
VARTLTFKVPDVFITISDTDAHRILEELDALARRDRSPGQDFAQAAALIREPGT